MFTIPILTYHKVTTKKEFGINNISPDRFETQIRTIIESGYTPITFKMLLKNDEKIPEKPIIITFDDGYQCVYNNIFPILLIGIIIGIYILVKKITNNGEKIKYKYSDKTRKHGLPIIRFEIEILVSIIKSPLSCHQ